MERRRGGGEEVEEINVNASMPKIIRNRKEIVRKDVDEILQKVHCRA